VLEQEDSPQNQLSLQRQARRRGSDNILGVAQPVSRSSRRGSGRWLSPFGRGSHRGASARLAGMGGVRRFVGLVLGPCLPRNTLTAGGGENDRLGFP